MRDKSTAVQVQNSKATFFCFPLLTRHVSSMEIRNARNVLCCVLEGLQVDDLLIYLLYNVVRRSVTGDHAGG